MELIVVFLIGISLSLDAFSLSIIYGMNNFNKKEMIKLSLIVGISHFVMPFLGMSLSKILFKKIIISTRIIFIIVLLFVGISMIFESFKKNKEKVNLNYWLFSLSVSLDSFSLGIGINEVTTEPIISFLVFSMFSFVFTYIGLKIGKKIGLLVGNISTLIAGLILILIAIFHIF